VRGSEDFVRGSEDFVRGSEDFVRGSDPYRTRLAEELHVINQRDLAGYFLVVRDIARYARRRGFSMALRGSAGNSLICYLLGITNVDPLRFKLPLERFLHAGRPDLPDIDLDFDWKVRDQVIAWAFERYGHAHTAMISSHLFLQPASAFREAGKAHGLSNEQISRLLEVWERGGFSKWEGASAEGWERGQGSGVRGQGSEVRGLESGGLVFPDPRPPTPDPIPPPGFPLEPERWPRLLADARQLIGRPHHLSIHPGGIVITPKPIENYVPLQRAAKGIVITQLDKDPIEHIGLVKIDLLGNRALATVDAARCHVRERKCERDKVTRRQGDKVTEGTDPSPLVTPSPCHLVASSPPPHAGALSLLQSGDTLGLNQLESPAMRHLLVQIQPRGLMDVIQALALIRPGAASIGAKERFVRRRRGLEPTVYDHPLLEPLLADTCGLMLYEDDALGVVQALTGFSAPEADHFRKRVTKTRDPEEALALSKAFLKACEQNGVSREAASKVWVQLAKFNEYSFCKSHAVSYGLIAWEAVRLKAEHPVEFWCAALNNNQGMYPRRVYVEAVKRAGIEVLLPCVNRSEREFSLEAEDDKVTRRQGDKVTGSSSCHPVTLSPCHPFMIRTGLAIIHGLDEAAREAILEDRSRRGLFADFSDFCQRVSVGAETLALLIQVGAFDFTGQTRPELLLEAELLAKRIADCGLRIADWKPLQPELFNPQSPIPNPKSSWSPTDFSQPRRWKEEWERLGFLVGLPLMSLFRRHLPKDLPTSRDITQLVGRRVCVAGLVATARHATTKHGQTMQFMTLEDEWGFIDVTFFPGTFPAATYLGMGPYLVWGVVEEQYDVVTVTATRFEKQAIIPWASS
jgi:DNA-directed DNA polymerase III PolC